MRKIARQITSALPLLALPIALAGCFTIHLKNGNQAATVPTAQKWHHIGIFSLVEFSKPEDLKKECSGRDWSEVTTETSAVQGLIGGLTGFYNPQTVKYTCSN